MSLPLQLFREFGSDACPTTPAPRGWARHPDLEVAVHKRSQQCGVFSGRPPSFWKPRFLLREVSAPRSMRPGQPSLEPGYLYTPSQALWGKETRNGLKDGLELVSPEMFSFSQSQVSLAWDPPNPGGDPKFWLEGWDPSVLSPLLHSWALSNVNGC